MKLTGNRGEGVVPVPLEWIERMHSLVHSSRDLEGQGNGWNVN